MPGLAQALDYMRPGDVLVVWKLDRLGRSLKDLVETVKRLQNEGKGFSCLDYHFDNTSPQGVLIFQLFADLAEFERNLIRERTNAGLAAARARGRVGGRKHKMSDEDMKLARVLMADDTVVIGDIARRFGVSRKTLYKSVRRFNGGEKSI